MVFNTPLARTGSVKRPHSAVKSEVSGWETAPSMMPSRATVNLPYAHYALIYLDNMGKLRVSESQSIREQQGTVFTPEVRDHFLEILGAKIGYQKPLIHRNSGVNPAALSYDHLDDMSYHRQEKRRRIHAHHSPSAMQNSRAEIPEEPSCPSVNNKMPLTVGDSEKMEQYYTISFRHFQQVNCRVVCKAFIKVIEPRKQVRHPYNGGRPKPGAPPGTKGDPEKTKPEWWPASVVHREPDHLKKEERVELLVHIVRRLSKIGITAAKLCEIAYDCRRQLKEQEKFTILEELFRVRGMEERFERGEVDASTIMYVVDREAHPKGDRDAESVTEAEAKAEPEAEEPIEAEEDVVTPTSSVEEISAPFTNLDAMTMPAPRPMPLADDRTQLYPMPETLSFGEPSRNDRQYYTSLPDYSTDYSHPIKPPSTPELTTPTEQHASSYDYLTHAPFSNPATADHHRPTALPMQHAMSHYDSWTPSYRPNMFGALDYPAPATEPIHYQMPISATSDVQEINGLPDLSHERPIFMDPSGARGHPFRTGSLSHPHYAHAVDQV
ncbi:kinesin [Aspergillus heteromorphus CBS 117.55]|uniref:Kinesin n=1 Tax=Aspergillus heteromorphus CBS 117.55 TaxID=1448321 RepID=A0A317VEU2_9EURO|nr:kinesin [Aspergillus heteromorphus CBS 117.55]PWY72893.1 kinesin [Aspergillus heteromorphus CBS 117.55]